MYRKAFTLIELLIVIAIIALLVSIVVPAMRKAREQARKMVCGTNLHQIQVACVAYANENKDMFPTRGKKYSGYPHAMINTDTNKSLDETFFEPYLSNMRDKVLFCPGALIRYRNPQIAQYDYTYITYQYLNYPVGNTMWISPNQPNLTKYTTARQASPLWTCLTVSEEGVVDPQTGKDLTHLSHNMVNEPHIPNGMNGVAVSGDTAWAKWDQCSPYLKLMPASSSRALKFYYPKSQ